MSIFTIETMRNNQLNISSINHRGSKMLLNNITRENFEEWANTYSAIYLEDVNIKFDQYRDSFHLTDITNAMKIGKTCVQFAINKADWNSNESLSNIIETDVKDLFNYCASLDYPDYNGTRTNINGIEVLIYRSELRSIRVFSPLNLSELKPLKSVPKKWTMSHVYKVLANNQFIGLKCTGHYTDDYAFDNSNNFGKGEASGMKVLKDILQNPSGWWTNGNENTLSFSCHSFLNYELTVKLNN